MLNDMYASRTADPRSINFDGMQIPAPAPKEPVLTDFQKRIVAIEFAIRMNPPIAVLESDGVNAFNPFDTMDLARAAYAFLEGHEVSHSLDDVDHLDWSKVVPFPRD